MEFKNLIFRSPIGDIHCIFEDKLLIRVLFGGNRINLKALMYKYSFKSDFDSTHTDKNFISLGNELQLYFKGSPMEFSQSIKLKNGTAFEQDVWLTLKKIPYGETRTYKWLAQKVGRSGAFRAVGNALRKNPLPLILPCHRVIASDGSLCGFSAGIELKKWLLSHESKHIITHA